MPKYAHIIIWKFLQNIPMSIHLLTIKQTILTQNYKQYSVITFHNISFDKTCIRRKALKHILRNGRTHSRVVSSPRVRQPCTRLCSTISFQFGLEHIPRVYPVIQTNSPGKCFAIALKQTKSLSFNIINLAISIWKAQGKSSTKTYTTKVNDIKKEH
jgi:hypothetical protein